jgi:hypothetical protein
MGWMVKFVRQNVMFGVRLVAESDNLATFV